MPQATGFIELLGTRAGTLHTALKIGFTLRRELAPPTFALYDTLALGTLTLPADCFGALLQFANCPTAHFRIGGDGSGWLGGPSHWFENRRSHATFPFWD